MSIWILGFVSMFMDISSEMIHSLLPLFMTSTLGLSMTSIGIIEGIAEATTLIVKIFSGPVSDYFGKRKLVVMIGYGMATLTKPLFPIADTAGMVFSARLLDRIGKGIRGAPRDALLSEFAPVEVRGASFGLRQTLDTVGAFIGPLLAITCMILLANNIRMVLWFAIIPAGISFLLLVFGVDESKAQHSPIQHPLMRIANIRYVGSAYWQLLAIGGVLTLARFSEAFLILKAQATGLPIAFVPMVMIVMNISYAIAAYPAGMISDYVNRKIILFIGVGFLVIADLVLGICSNTWMLAIGVSLWGLHMAFTQGLLVAMVADSTPVELRGTAYGLFSFVCGISLLAASIIAGLLWDHFGSAIMFFIGAGFSALTLVGIIMVIASGRKVNL